MARGLVNRRAVIREDYWTPNPSKRKVGVAVSLPQATHVSTVLLPTIVLDAYLTAVRIICEKANIELGE